MQEEAQNNVQRVKLIIVNGIKSLRQNSVVIDRDYWLKVTLISTHGRSIWFLS